MGPLLYLTLAGRKVEPDRGWPPACVSEVEFAWSYLGSVVMRSLPVVVALADHQLGQRCALAISRGGFCGRGASGQQGQLFSHWPIHGLVPEEAFQMQPRWPRRKQL